MKCDACPVAGRCVVEATGHVRYCDWAASGKPAWVAEVIRLSTIEPEEQYPPLKTQLGNAGRALGRVASAIVHDEPVLVTHDEQDRRLAICQACPHYDQVKLRCKICGCGGLKLYLATEKCPDKPPRW